MKNTFRKMLRIISGFIVFLLAFPFLLVLQVIGLLVESIQDILSFSWDFLKSQTDPEYVPPIGVGGFYALQCYWKKACRAEKDQKKDEALKYWKKCAALYNVEAMLQAARHYEAPGSGMPDLKRASDFYALAGSYGSPTGEAKYVSLTGQELSDQEKKRVQEDFIRTRRTWLQEPD